MTIIDISRKFYILENDLTYTYCINLVEAIIRNQNLLLTCRKLPTVALSYHVKIRIINVMNSFGCYQVRMFH